MYTCEMKSCSLVIVQVPRSPDHFNIDKLGIGPGDMAVMAIILCTVYMQAWLTLKTSFLELPVFMIVASDCPVESDKQTKLS